MKALRVVLIALLCAGIGGCGIMGTKTPQVDVVGTWNGKAQDGSPWTMVFGQDGTVRIWFTYDGYDLDMSGKYTIDYTTDPIAIDLNELYLSEAGITLYCLGIAAFPEPDIMTFYGQMGESSGGSRPTEFNSTPGQLSASGELYLELTKD